MHLTYETKIKVMNNTLHPTAIISTFLCIFLFSHTFIKAQSNAFSLRDDVTVEHIAEFPGGGFLDGPIRMVKDLVSGNLLYNQYFGNIYEIDQSRTTPQFNFLYSTADHGLPIVQGMTMHNDILYLVGNEEINNGNDNVGIIAKGVRTNGNQRTWTILARTEPYLGKAETPYDHKMSGNAVSPDGQFIYVSSSSRTNHGELAGEGRDEPLTTIILKIPTNLASTITLRNDRAWLRANGYLYAEGIRNGFDMAFDQNGNLFEVENSGQRDDPEEMNWLREGRHYGFPWRLGGNENPIQVAGYNSLNDLLVPPDQRGTPLFAYDSDFPAIPDGLVFTEPMRNLGPDADLYRDPQTGEIRDASEDGVEFTTFTSHRSPVGFGFDNENQMGGNYTGDAFIASFSGNTWPLIGGDSEDLLHLELTYNAALDNYDINTYKIAAGFAQPIDIVIDGNVIWLAEYGDEINHGLYKITLPEKETIIEPDYSCADIEAVGGEGQISITGLTAPRVYVDIRNASAISIFDCGPTNCDTTQIIEGLPAGEYRIIISFFTEDRESFCSEAISVTVTEAVVDPVYSCDLVEVVGGPEEIAISNLDALIEDIIIYDTNFNIIRFCQTQDCGGSSTYSGIEPGEYLVQVNFYTDDGLNTVCSTDLLPVTVIPLPFEPQEFFCGQAQITGGTGQITVSNLLAPLKKVRIFDENFVPLFECVNDDCGETYVQTELAAGNYFVEVGYFTETQIIGICSPRAVVVTDDNTEESESCDSTYLNDFTFLGTVNQQSFYLSHVALPWEEARESCRTLGGEIASLDGEGEEDFIRNHIEGEVFIGLSDLDTEGQFRWGSGAFYNEIVCHNNEENDVVYLAAWMEQFIAADNSIWKPYVCTLDCPEDLGGNGLRRANSAWEWTTYQKAQNVEIQWLVEDISDTEYFVIERSTDGKTYSALTTVETRQANNIFHFTDTTPFLGDNFYRLRQHYSDNELRYSNVQKETILTPKKDFMVFPNPTKDILQIRAITLAEKRGDIQIFNAFGQLVKTIKDIEFSDTTQKISVANLENGLYYLTIKVDARKAITVRFIVEKLD